jgi:hypothetical protein
MNGSACPAWFAILGPADKVTWQGFDLSEARWDGRLDRSRTYIESKCEETSAMSDVFTPIGLRYPIALITN